MSEELKDDLNKVDDLKTKIFSKSYDTKIEPRHLFMTNFKPDKVKEEIEPLNTNKEFEYKNNSFFKKFFIFSITIFVGAIGFLLFNLFFQNNDISSKNIEISVIGNTFVDGGEKLPLIVEIVNNNKIPLEFADLVIEYPKGSALNSGRGEIVRLRQSIGFISQSSVTNEKIDVLLFGEQGSIHEIKISLEYRIEGSNAIFVKDKFYKVTINSTPVDLIIDAPTDITPNQDFTFKVKTIITEKENPNNLNMILKIDYPFGFEFVDANPKPTLGNNIWGIEELSLIEKEITITGRMIDVYEGEQKVFHISTGPQKRTDKSEIDVVFNSLAHITTIKKPFVEARLSINSTYKKDYVVYPTDLFLGTINWVNNLTTNIDDLEIRAKLSGNAFDESTIILNQNGFYDSINDTIIWNSSNTENFRNIRPKASGIVAFSMKPASIFGKNGELLIDPVINIEISVSGKQSSLGNVVNKLDLVEKKTIKLASQVSLLNKVTYSQNPIPNTGPFPPQAEKETTYTITLSIANTLNNISRTKVVATLAPRVNYKEVFFPKDSDIIFDPNTRELTWNVGNIKRGEGLKGGLRELSFQVSYTPSLFEVDKNPVILNKVLLTGYDDFANVVVSLSKGILSLNSKIVK